MKEYRVALAHHWLTGIRGGEKVLEQFCLMFPGSPVSALVVDTNKLELPDWLRDRRLGSSALRFFPWAVSRFKSFLPLFPILVRYTLRVEEEVDVVLSTDASVVKGLKVPDGCVHMCYCHSPPRYLWDLQETYLAQASGLGVIGRLAFKLTTPYIRRYDFHASKNVDYFIANSEFVANRIDRYYGRESKVIYPPVAVNDFRYLEEKSDFYLIVSELVPYKRIDLAIDAFNQSGKRLIVIGDGSERERLKKTAKSNVSFLGRQPLSVLVEHYSKARAFVFPGIEDFGITPLEAQASGTPVIALGKGGALETVVDGKTGVFFRDQTCSSLNDAIESFERSKTISSRECRENAVRFGEERFRKEISEYMEKCLSDANK